MHPTTNHAVTPRPGRRPDSPSWTAAFKRGAESEQRVADALRAAGYNVMPTRAGSPTDLRLIASVEVKRDDRHQETGNVAVEIARDGMPSGIAATPAGVVIYDLGNELIEISASRIKRLALDSRRHVAAGDGGRTTVALVAVHELRRAGRVIPLSRGA